MVLSKASLFLTRIHDPSIPLPFLFPFSNLPFSLRSCMSSFFFFFFFSLHMWFSLFFVHFLCLSPGYLAGKFISNRIRIWTSSANFPISLTNIHGNSLVQWSHKWLYFIVAAPVGGFKVSSSCLFVENQMTDQ